MTNSSLFSLAGRTAVITGGSRGIGEMIAAGFLEAGAKVYVSSRKAAACDEAAARLSVLGECFSLPADVSTVEGCRKLASAVADREGGVDVLINNAGATWGAPLDEFPESGWDKVVDLNMKSPFFLTQAFLPLLRAAASPAVLAKVINIASIDGLRMNSEQIYSYQASKAGLLHLTRRLAAELIDQNIVVSAIAPGAFASAMNQAARDNADVVSKFIPARRIGTREDIQGAAIYLASRAGDYAVGVTLTVDGGVTFANKAI